MLQVYLVNLLNLFLVSAVFRQQQHHGPSTPIAVRFCRTSCRLSGSSRANTCRSSYSDASARINIWPSVCPVPTGAHKWPSLTLWWLSTIRTLECSALRTTSSQIYPSATANVAFVRMSDWGHATTWLWVCNSR